MFPTISVMLVSHSRRRHQGSLLQASRTIAGCWNIVSLSVSLWPQNSACVVAVWFHSISPVVLVLPSHPSDAEAIFWRFGTVTVFSFLHVYSSLFRERDCSSVLLKHLLQLNSDLPRYLTRWSESELLLENCRALVPHSFSLVPRFSSRFSPSSCLVSRLSHGLNFASVVLSAVLFGDV